MKDQKIAAVMIHAPDWKKGLEWYAKAFPQAKRDSLPEFDFECLELNGIRIEVVTADEKVGTGTFGVVVYWKVDHFDDALKYLRNLGAVLYRGPMNIENGWRMCQLKDPFGNLLGLRGP